MIVFKYLLIAYILYNQINIFYTSVSATEEENIEKVIAVPILQNNLPVHVADDIESIEYEEVYPHMTGLDITIAILKLMISFIMTYGTNLINMWNFIKLCGDVVHTFADVLNEVNSTTASKTTPSVSHYSSHHSSTIISPNNATHHDENNLGNAYSEINVTNGTWLGANKTTYNNDNFVNRFNEAQPVLNKTSLPVQKSRIFSAVLTPSLLDFFKTKIQYAQSLLRLLRKSA